MATQLGVINDALAMLGDREITQAELDADSQEGGRVMKSAWPAAVDQCLCAAPWIFASRVEELTAEGAEEEDPSIYAVAGYDRAWPAPDSHMRTNWVKEYARSERQVEDKVYQDRFWHTNTRSLFVSYVSHDYRPPEHWTPLFAQVVATYLAMVRGPRIRPAADAQELRMRYEKALDNAKTQDASEKPSSRHPIGSLVRSRGGWGSGENGGWRY